MSADPQRVRLQAEVAGDALEAFDRFAAAIDDWWASAAAAAAESGEVELESYAGGRLVVERAPPEPELALGRVKIWRPGTELEAEWREPGWPHGALTSIRASFDSTGSTTAIFVEHRGFELLGEAADAVARRYETLWRQLLESL